MSPLDKQFKEYILEHPQETRESALEIKEWIQDAPLTYQAKNKIDTTQTLHIPKFYTQEDKKLFEEISDTMYNIFLKVIDAYKKDPEIQKLFQFDPALHEMIMMDTNCAAPLPILRVDIFYDEKSREFYFCEFNADGTSSMGECALMNHIVRGKNNVWKALQPDVEAVHLVKAYADALLDIYNRSEHGGQPPKIVVTDFLENSYKTDLEAFQEYFTRAGYDFEIEDIRNLGYDGKKLYSKKTGTPYDLVYRRAVTTDVLDHLNESKALLDAAKDKNVVLVGPFSTQIPHSKVINEALLNPVLQKYLDQDEVEFIKAHMPATFPLDTAHLETIRNSKDKWIIKPKEGYGSMDVYAGTDLDQKEWEKLIDKLVDQDFVVQQFIPHYQSENIDPLGNEGFRNYSNTTGLYVYDGKFQGVLSRLSDGNVVSSQYNRKMIPTYFTKD